MTSAADKISGRQLEILQRKARGDYNKEIAAALGIAESTLETYIARLLRRLAARNCTQALHNFTKLKHPEFSLSSPGTP